MQQKQLGKYKFDQFLGGGMSHVYKATDTLINRTVVVKILTDSGMHDEDTKKRFLREAQTAGSITHENIIRVYDFGEHEGRPYMVMEYLQGNDLRAGIQQGQLPNFVDKLKVVVQLGKAMQHIQELGIVHRDLKPDNVFLSTTGQVKLMDFGIAKTKDLSITRTGYTLGTPYYMAPEQVTSKDVNMKADIYAFGVVMFELFTGTKPFKAENVHEVFFKILNEPMDPAPMIEAKVPTSIVDLVKRCMAKEQPQRPADFGIIIKELEATLKLIEGASEQELTQLSKPAFVVPKMAWIGGGVAVVLLIAVIALLPKSDDKKKPDEKKAGPAVVVEMPARVDTKTGPMVLVEAGAFQSGANGDKKTLKAFYLDVNEVSNELYKKFSQEKGWPLPENFPDDEASKQLPVVNVTFIDAREYALWAGKRLPLGDEWEKAARGPSGRSFPWGYESLPEYAVVKNNPKLKGIKGPKPVGSWADSTSYYKAMDLAGNVFEWVDERSTPNPRAIAIFASLLKPAPTAEDLWVQIRGGSFDIDLIDKVSLEWSTVPSRFKAKDIGFRCVAGAESVPK
jgi:eukaryotic-like serine/threonine-protein kinase